MEKREFENKQRASALLGVSKERLLERLRLTPPTSQEEYLEMYYAFQQEVLSIEEAK